MFKLYHITNNSKKEVMPINDLYTVNELGSYEFSYEGIISRSNGEHVFIEDIPVKRDLYIQSNNIIKSTKPYRLFEDYFGFASFNLNGEIFKLNIQIEKFKLSEIEDILMFLWESENRIFDNFFSKSTLKSKISNDGSDYGLTSKFIAFVEYFHQTFSELYLKFKNIPFSVLRKRIETVDYVPQQVTSHTIDWLLNNLDYVDFDNSFHNYPNSIIVDNRHGYIDKIETDKNTTSYAVYENEIILGAFQHLLNKLSNLEKAIISNINIDLEHSYGNNNFADFRDLKKVPFVKLFDECKNFKRKLTVLYQKYRSIFKGTSMRIEKPRVTNVFSQSPHYRLAYRIIKDSFEYKFNFNGELNFLNVKKLSQLYEAYNLHQISLCFKRKLNTDLFQINSSSSRKDGITNYISFESQKNLIEIFYDLSYPNTKTNLIRIEVENEKGNYYRPDYIIQITIEKNIYLIILDSKYSKFETVKSKYLHECVEKYILNTGFINERYKKTDGFILLYPGEIEEVITGDLNYSPHIKILPSKPKFEEVLSRYINEIVEKVLPTHLYIKEYNDLVVD